MTHLAYYNEIDPTVCQWLENLIKAGHIAPGHVDNRSISDVKPSDLAGYSQCHFLSTSDQGLLAGSSFCREVGGMLGITPKPFQAICSLKCFFLFRSFRVLGDVRFPKHGFLRMTRNILEQVGLCGKNESDLSQEVAFLSSEPCTNFHGLDLQNGTREPSCYSLFSCIHPSKFFAGLHLALQKIVSCTLSTPLVLMCLFLTQTTDTLPRIFANSKDFLSALYRTRMSSGYKPSYTYA
jgi:hypothetical protein